MTDSKTTTAIEGRVHGTPDEVWDVLARLFKVTTSDQGHQWVAVEQNGAKITFYGPKLHPPAAVVEDVPA